MIFQLSDHAGKGIATAPDAELPLDPIITSDANMNDAPFVVSGRASIHGSVTGSRPFLA